MTDSLSITLAQLNQTVGDIAANSAAMLAARDRARSAGADLVVFPEMQLIGYPPEDLVLKPALIERAAAGLEQLALATADGGPAMLVGSVFVRDGNLHNGVALLDGGKIAAVRFKHDPAPSGIRRKARERVRQMQFWPWQRAALSKHLPAGRRQPKPRSAPWLSGQPCTCRNAPGPVAVRLDRDLRPTFE